MRSALALLLIDKGRGTDLVLPLLGDPDSTVRWHVCGLMHEFGDERAVEPLVDRMRNDLDPQVRGIAAYALGRVGNMTTIPALRETAEHDHEVDQLGYDVSSVAGDSIEEILKRNQGSQ